MARMNFVLAAALAVRPAAADSRIDRVRAAAHSLPDIDPKRVDEAVDAAFQAETDRVPAELLLSIAWGETRFVSTVRTGRVCGVMGVNPEDIGRPRSDCRRWGRDPLAGFRAGVTELEEMLADRRVHGRMRWALLYRACGNSAFDGTCRKGAYPGWVLRRAARLKGAPHAKPLETL